MLFRLPNGMRLFVPAMFPTEKARKELPLFNLLYILELISIFAMYPAVILLINVLRNSVRLFHRNLRQVAQAHLIMFALSETSRIYIVFYDAGLIEQDAIFDQLLFTLFFIRFATLCGVITIIPSVITERTLASRYISNYENAKRPLISYMVNGTSLLLAASYYALAMMGIYSVLALLLLSIVIMLLSSFTMVMVFRRDAAKLRDLSNKNGRSTLHYTLSMKFQLAENVRVMKLLTYASLGISLWAMCGCSLFGNAFVVSGEESSIGQLSYAVWNVYVAISFATVVWSSLAAIGKLQCLLYCFSKYSCCLYIPASREKLSAQVYDPHGATESYFVQLHSAWAPQQRF